MTFRSRVLQAAIILALVAFVLYQAHPADLWRELRGVDPTLLGAAIALNLPIALLTPVRSALVLKHLGYSLPFRFLAPATFVGFVLGGLTPAASGEFVRASSMRGAGVPLETGLSLVIFERVMAAYLLAISTVFALAITSLAPLEGGVVAVACTLGVVLPWLFAKLMPRRGAAGSAIESARWRRIATALIDMVRRVSAICSDLRLVLAWSVPSLAIIGLTALQYFLTTQSVGGEIGFGEAWAAFGVSAAVAIASLLPFGLGAGDGSLAAVLHRFGLDFERATAAAILVRLTVTIPLVLIAIAAQVYLNRQRASSSPASTVNAVS